MSKLRDILQVARKAREQITRLSLIKVGIRKALVLFKKVAPHIRLHTHTDDVTVIADYICADSLNDIYKTAREYKAKNNLKHIPTLKYVFFNENDDTLAKLDEKLEKTIEDLCNSKYRNIIIQLNEMPVLAIKPVSSPFKKRWMNIVLLFILPLSILIYARSVRFRIKLLMDLTKVERKSKEINEIIKKEKLI